MRSRKISGAAVVLAAMLAEQGCWFRKTPPKASIVIPPAPQAQPPQPLPTPPQLPPTDPKPAEKVAQVPALPPPVAAPKPAKKPATRRTNPPVVAEQPPVEAPPVAVPTPAPQPALGPSLQPILGQREVEQRNRRIQDYLEKARLKVLRAERSNPDAARKQLIGQVRTFLQQAEEARKVDLVRAENLAERAEVLSRGLSN